jgi:sigma-E factor negative regulatory protein RseA
MEKISQLMDGELGRRETKTTIELLESDQALAQSWETYHLIGDSLRRETELPLDFTRRLHERLGQEPTLIAPHMRLSHRVVRYTLPLAAGVAGVTLVIWLALPLQQAAQPGSAALTLNQPRSGPRLPLESNRGAVNDYLTAHQEFSPSTAMQGLASYVRTVAPQESSAR